MLDITREEFLQNFRDAPPGSLPAVKATVSKVFQHSDENSASPLAGGGSGYVIHLLRAWQFPGN